MKLYKTLLASALCAPLIPALADGALLDFNDIAAGVNSVQVLDSYGTQGIHFSDAAFAVRSNLSGNTDGSGGFYTPYPAGGSNANIGALAIASATPIAGQPSSFTVQVDAGFSGYFKALVGVSQQSNVTVDLLDKAGNSLGQETLNVPGSTGGCEAQMVCDWSPLSIGFGGTAYAVTVSGMESLAWFDNFDFGPAASSDGRSSDVPEPASILLATGALCALAWSRRRLRER